MIVRLFVWMSYACSFWKKEVPEWLQWVLGILMYILSLMIFYEFAPEERNMTWFFVLGGMQFLALALMYFVNTDERGTENCWGLDVEIHKHRFNKNYFYYVLVIIWWVFTWSIPVLFYTACVFLLPLLI